MSNKKAIIVQGGWDGHTPKESAALFEKELKAKGYDVTVHDSMDVYTDTELMATVDLIVPIWTMGQITNEQWQGLDKAVAAGTGIAGFHGGIIDSFRNNCDYQWMTGGQWVAHPGNCIPEYEVNIVDGDHPITQGIQDFKLTNTEQYYVHVDPANRVLATTTFEAGKGDITRYQVGTVLPYAWIKQWGKGKVFVACWGHTFKDFDCKEALEITLRGMQWATR
jgi:type 1 glutamine amidotransferase